MKLFGLYSCNFHNGIVKEKTSPYKIAAPLACHVISDADISNLLVTEGEINPIYV